MKSSAHKFSRKVFLDDLELTASALGAPYDPSVTRAVLNTYARSFREGAVLWRATSRPGDSLEYLLCERRSMDTVGMAVRAGLLASGNKMARIAGAWSARYPESTQICDFDSFHGLSKTWIYPGEMRPVDHIFAEPETPGGVRQIGAQLQDIGLQCVRHLVVSYLHNTVTVYFSVAGPFHRQRCSEVVALANADGDGPSPSIVSDMSRFITRERFTFSVTMTVEGEIERVGFKAPKLPTGQWPAISGRLVKFFQTAPSRDAEETNGVAWSFGADDATYMKAERSYSGRLAELMRQRKCPLSA
jgi:4-hydroxyphenylpyruvate 3-dimethylallyltransferase